MIKIKFYETSKQNAEHIIRNNMRAAEYVIYNGNCVQLMDVLCTSKT